MEPYGVQDERRLAKVDAVPITGAHLPPPPSVLEAAIPAAGMPRANRAPSIEKPQGSPTSPPNATVLQQHCMWFDRDGDGVIYPIDTFRSFHDLSFNFMLSSIAAAGLHLGLSWVTLDSWIPSPFFPILLANIHRAKHGSDTQVYDNEGRYIPQKFEEIFSKFDRDSKGGLSIRDLAEMLRTNMNTFDLLGWYVAKDDNGIVSREKIRAQYDGSVWEIIAAEVEDKRRHQVGVLHRLKQIWSAVSPPVAIKD